MATYENPYAQLRTASGLNILTGLWLLFAPWVLGYAAVESAMFNSVVIGIAIAVLAIFRVATPLQYESISWGNFILGIWLVLAPSMLGFGEITVAMWNHVVVGFLVLILAAWSAVSTRNMTRADLDRTTGGPDV